MEKERQAIADLQPLLCIEPCCQNPKLLQESRNNWVEHQRSQHAMGWWSEGNDTETEHAAVKVSAEVDILAHVSKHHTPGLPTEV